VDDLEERVAKSYEECMSALSDPDADEARPVGEDDALMDEFVTNLGKRPTSAFSTGIDDLDRAMIARNGALILLSADTGVGKSLLAAQIARHYARDRGERVLFHSLEMSRDEMVERDMSAVSGVALSKITGVHDLEPSNYDLIKDEYLPAYREWASRLHYVEGKASVSEVARNAQRLNHEHRGDSGIGLVVLDYLQIAKRPRDVSTERDDLALAAMTGALKELAMDLGCVVICISQFNNEGAKSSAPQTYHLKGSSSLGQDADVVGMMIDPSKDDESRAGEVEVSLPKVRKGVSGTTVTIAEQRHKAHFRALNDNDRADMSVADRLNAPSPLPT
ncbi:DnaB-like helicase C-terminal domain-containing protein, partial [Halosaccharopolyspora lacisalsi]